MVNVVFRTIIIYMFLLLTLRVMGKRQIGELQISELIVTFMLSELAVNPIANPSMPLLHALIPILLLVSIEGVLSFWMTKSNRVRRLLSGTPAVLICRGELDQKAMAENRLELDELLAALRQNGVGNPDEVEYAILEKNGKISVFLKTENNPLRCKDVKVKVPENGIAHAVVTDGDIMNDELLLAGKTAGWVAAELKRRKMDLKDVYLMTVDDLDTVYVVKRRGDS